MGIEGRMKFHDQIDVLFIIWIAALLLNHAGLGPDDPIFSVVSITSKEWAFLKKFVMLMITH